MKIIFLLVLLAAVTPYTYSQQRDELLFPAVDGNQTTYVDRTGKVAFTVPYSGYSFSEGLARVTIKDQTGYIDRTGKLVIGPIPYNGRDFSNGLAMVETEERCTTSETKQKYGYIDRTGAFVIPATLTRPCYDTGEQFYFTKEGL